MDILSFKQWDDIRSHLNGYSMTGVSMDSQGNLVAKTSEGNVVLATPLASFWQPVDGPAYTAMERIFDDAKDLIKESGDYSRANKEKILIDLINQKVVPLFQKYKK